MKNFQYCNHTRFIFGKGEETNVGNIIKEYGATKVMIMHYGTGLDFENELNDRVIASLTNAGLKYYDFTGIVRAEVEIAEKAVSIIKEKNIDFLLPVGGGAVIDVAKYASVAVKHNGNTWEDFYLGKQPIPTPLPMGAISTVAASGSENSPDSVIGNGELKRTMSDIKIRPLFAIINPDDAIKINGVVGIVEYKTCNFGSEKMQLWKNDIVPFEYYLQVAYYMAIKNVPYAVICVKFGISEEDFKYFVIHRDFDVEDEILKMAEELCKDVESGVEPSLDRGKAELLLQYYKKRFGSLKVKERNVLLDTSYIFDAEELIELHEKLESAKQAEKQYKSDIKEKTLAIAKAADGASTAYIPYGKTGKYVQVSLRSSVRKSSLVDVDKVYEKYPDLYERYVERNFNAAAFIKENPQLLEECKKDELVYSESTSDGVKMVEQGYVDKIFRNKEEGKNGKSKKK